MCISNVSHSLGELGMVKEVKKNFPLVLLQSIYGMHFDENKDFTRLNIAFGGPVGTIGSHLERRSSLESSPTTMNAVFGVYFGSQPLSDAASA